MGEETTSLGGIHISPKAVAAIAYHATLQSYGVVGLAPKNFAEGLAQTITREPARGVSVQYDGENIDIDLYIIVEYGTRIPRWPIAWPIPSGISVEKALGMSVHEVNVHIAGPACQRPGLGADPCARTLDRKARLSKRPFDGQALKRLTEAGLAWLKTNQQTVNALNVFPVPDGDTGTNMMLTMTSAWNEIKVSGEKHVGRMAALVAKGALMGARGNSGVILSQLWRGFARGLQDSEMIDGAGLVRAFVDARDTAYKGVVRPVEGTILTVAKDTAAAAEAALLETQDPIEVLEKCLPAAQSLGGPHSGAIAGAQTGWRGGCGREGPVLYYGGRLAPYSWRTAGCGAGYRPAAVLLQT